MPPFYARNFPFWPSIQLPWPNHKLLVNIDQVLSSQMYVCRSRPTFRFLGSRSGKKKVLSKSMDTHTSWWQAAANALAMPFVSLFCCVPQAQLRGKGHEKRNWKWIFWRSYFFYLACEKPKKKITTSKFYFLFSSSWQTPMILEVLQFISTLAWMFFLCIWKCWSSFGLCFITR